MSIIEKDLKFNREILVVFGLLLGCDYDPKGVPGCGKEMACKFLNEIIESNEPINIFDKIRKWSTDKNKKYSKYEEKVRRLALENAQAENKKFPNENIINEYMTFSKVTQIIMSEEKYLTIKWNRPNLNLFQVFTIKNL